MTDTALDPEVVAKALLGMPGWLGDSSALSRAWHFADFAAAIRFMHTCVPGIDARNHHPEWTNVYDRVSVLLRTHDAGDRVTAADLDLARHLTAVAAECGGR